MEKDNDSIATVQMKPEYAPSEVYSTASEPPPAYKMRNSNSVKIAKIVGGTVILSSLIIGICILGSTYLQAKASCNYMDSVQAAIEKELLMDRFDDYPRAEALHESESNVNNLLNLNEKSESKKNINKKDTEIKSDSAAKDSDSDSSYSESDESDELNRIQIKLPLELDLDNIANAILQSNQKSKMNCVVERRRAEEVVDTPAKSVQLPFGLNISTDPKKQKVTGERLVIMCESGTETRNDEDDDVEQIRQIIVPLNAVPLQFGPRGPQFPITHLPHQMGPPPQQQMFHPHPQHHQQQQPQFHHQPPPQYQQSQQHEMRQHFVPPQMMHQLPPQPHMTVQFQPQPQSHIQQVAVHELPPQPPVPAQMMQAPRPEQPEVRIQLQRVQIPIRELNDEGIVSIEEQQPHQHQQQEAAQGREMPQQQQQIHVQQLPLAVALQRAGITAEDLRNIQRMAEEKIQEELRQFVSDESSESEDGNSSSEEDQTNQLNQHQQQQRMREQMMQQQQQQQQQHGIPPQILQMGRASFGRSLITPVRIPVPMMQQVQESQSDEAQESERPHYVHPRSVRSVDSVLTKRTKRACACDCAC